MDTSKHRYRRKSTASSQCHSSRRRSSRQSFRRRSTISRDTRLLRQSVATFSLAIDDLQEWDFDDDEDEDDEDRTSDLQFIEEGEDIKPHLPRLQESQEEDGTDQIFWRATGGEAKGAMKSQGKKGEDWQVINSLFSYLDKDGSGTLETSDLVNALHVIGDMDLREVITQATASNKALTKEQLHHLLFARRERTDTQDLALFVLMWALPLFYAATTRLPFICVALEVTVARNGTLWQVGVILGAYQTCRAFANAIIARFGGNDPLKRLNFPMILFGLFGWLFSFFAVETGSVWSLLAICSVGLAEVVVNLQTSLILETQLESPAHVADPGTLSARLRSQYAAISSGSFLAYVVGGSLYTASGFRAVCLAGVVCQVLQLIGTAIFWWGTLAQGKERGDCLNGRQLLRSITYRIKAMLVIVQEARDTSTNLTFEEPGIAEASRLARSDTILIDSLRKLYDAFFSDRAQQRAKKETRDNRMSTKMAIPMEQMLASANDLSFRDLNISNISDNSNSGLENIDFAKVAMRLMDTSGDGNVTEKEFVSYLAPRVYLSLFGSFRLTAVNVVWPYLKFVVLTQAIMALCIGTFLSTALLMYTEHFDISAGTVGILLGVGEGLGAVVIFTTPTSSAPDQSRSTRWTIFGRSRSRGTIEEFEFDEKPSLLTTLATRPLHVPMVLLVLGIATIGFSAHIFAVAVIFQMVMSSVNDLGVTLLNELIATSVPADKFKPYQGFGQWLRRLGNVFTGILGPILFGLNPDFPFLLFGGIVVVWSLILWFLLYCHASQITDDTEDEASRKRAPGPVDVFRECVHTPWHILEREYFASNKEKIEEKLAPTRNAVLDVEVIEHRVRRIGAALRAEAAKRQDLEAQLNLEAGRRKELEEQVALIKEPTSIGHCRSNSIS